VLRVPIADISRVAPERRGRLTGADAKLRTEPSCSPGQQASLSRCVEDTRSWETARRTRQGSPLRSTAVLARSAR
jgi:hypothetical protein